MAGVWDVINQDAFTLESLTAAINKLAFTPGQLSASGLFSEAGVLGLTALMEELEEIVSRAEVRPRGGPPMVVNADKRKMRSLLIPHLPGRAAISADEIRQMRQFGSENMEATVEIERAKRLLKMLKQINYAIEYHRVEALKGNYVDVNGDVQSAFTFFNAGSLSTVSLALGTATTKVLTICDSIRNAVEDGLGGISYTELHGWLNKDMWGLFVDHPAVKEAWLATEAANARTQNIDTPFVFGNIRWHRYRGNSTVSLGSKTGYVIPVGVDDMFITRYAPSTYLDSVGETGLPYYSQAYANQNNTAIEMEAQSNPLNICTLPAAIHQVTTP